MEAMVNSIASEPRLTSSSDSFRSAVSHNIHEIMKAHPELNSLGCKMILKIYNLPIFSKLIDSGKRFTIVTKTESGIFRYRPLFVNEMLMGEGLYEPHVKEMFRPEKGETVIDIGSNIGFYTLRAARHVGTTGKVVSIEANPETFRILKSNILENHYDNVVALCCAAGSENGFGYLDVPSNYPAGSKVLQEETDSRTSYERIPVTTIDSLVLKLGLKRVDWMKVDVEGTDAEVIEGCKNVIRTHKPKIIIKTGNANLVQYFRESDYFVTSLKGVIGFVYAYPRQLSSPTMTRMHRSPRVETDQPNVVYPMQESWDVMIVLDACRYDFFEKVYSEYIPGRLQKRTSPGSNTLEWLRNAFTEYYDDCVYVSGNPFIGYSKKIIFNSFRMNFKGSDHFHKIIEVWKSEWDDKLGTVLPNAVNQAAIQAYEEYPSKRFIVHYMQPHYPYIGFENLPSRRPTIRVMSWAARETLTKVLGKRIGNKAGSAIAPSVEELVGKKLGIAKYHSAYEKNLRFVLKSVTALLDCLQGRIIITADHGELLGEEGMFGHHAGFPRIRQQIEVPWLTIDRPQRHIQANSRVINQQMEENDESIVRKRLQALGYD